MRYCNHCAGDLLRHGVTYYAADPSIIGIRYRCRKCNKTFTQRMKDDKRDGNLMFSKTGRPTVKDWRMDA